jgi:hypothetical protein
LVGTAQERLCLPYDLRTASSALRRVDIEKGAKALDRHFRHRFGMPFNELGANVAIERQQLVEEAARASSAFGRRP